MSVTSIETGSVLHRHEKAMSVVDGVDDADARWALLDYVLHGSENVDAVIGTQSRRRARRPGLHAEVVRLRDEEGLTFQEIADRLGYANDSGPWCIYRRATELRSLRSAA